MGRLVALVERPLERDLVGVGRRDGPEPEVGGASGPVITFPPGDGWRMGPVGGRTKASPPTCACGTLGGVPFLIVSRLVVTEMKFDTGLQNCALLVKLTRSNSTLDLVSTKFNVLFNKLGN